MKIKLDGNKLLHGGFKNSVIIGEFTDVLTDADKHHLINDLEYGQEMLGLMSDFYQSNRTFSDLYDIIGKVGEVFRKYEYRKFEITRGKL